jgi:hypothetical protein
LRLLISGSLSIRPWSTPIRSARPEDARARRPADRTLRPTIRGGRRLGGSLYLLLVPHAKAGVAVHDHPPAPGIWARVAQTRRDDSVTRSDAPRLQRKLGFVQGDRVGACPIAARVGEGVPAAARRLLQQPGDHRIAAVGEPDPHVRFPRLSRLRSHLAPGPWAHPQSSIHLSTFCVNRPRGTHNRPTLVVDCRATVAHCPALTVR